MLRFHPPDADGAAGAVFSAVLVDAHALVLFGAAPQALPETGAALFDEAGTVRGPWRAVSWARAADGAGDGTAGFFAVLGLDSVTQLPAGGLRIVRGIAGAQDVLPPIGRVDLDPGAMIEALRGEAAPAAPVLDVLHEAVAAPAFAGAAGLHGFRMAALAALSRQSGFVEIVARPECGGLLVQGWSCDLAPGGRTLIVQHGPDAVAPFEAVVAGFAREDLLDGARGTVAFMKDARADEVLDLARVYFAVGDAYRHLDVVPEPVRFAPEDVVPHLEAMLPALAAEEPVRRAFKRICRPRFGGADTVSAAPVPVRLSVDRALHVPGTGFFLAGWMLDPEDAVMLVLFKSTGNFYRRIHESWHRTARPDVVAGFAGDELFRPLAPRLSGRCGFLLFIPHEDPVGADEAFYVEIVLKDETCFFLPVAFDARAPDAVAAEILEAADIDDPGFDALVEAHLGPLVAGAFAARALPDRAETVVPFGAAETPPAVSVVLPVTGGGADIDVNLSRLSGDPDLDAAELVLIVSRETLSVPPVRLAAWAGFYGFSGRVVVAAAALDRFDAFGFGAAQAGADRLLLLADSVLPDAPGWLGALSAALEEHPDAAAISPTLLYEDFSIRFAGLPLAETPALGRGGLCRLSGYPLHWLDGREAEAVHGLSEDCLLIRRAAFESAGGFARGFTGPALKGVDFSLRLARAGGTMLWTPAVTLFALDEAPPDEARPYWTRPARRVDEWQLARLWSPAFGSAPPTTPGTVFPR